MGGNPAKGHISQHTPGSCFLSSPSSREKGWVVLVSPQHHSTLSCPPTFVTFLVTLGKASIVSPLNSTVLCNFVTLRVTPREKDWVVPVLSQLHSTISCHTYIITLQDIQLWQRKSESLSALLHIIKLLTDTV